MPLEVTKHMSSSRYNTRGRESTTHQLVKYPRLALAPERLCTTCAVVFPGENLCGVSLKVSGLCITCVALTEATVASAATSTKNFVRAKEGMAGWLAEEVSVQRGPRELGCAGERWRWRTHG